MSKELCEEQVDLIADSTALKPDDPMEDGLGVLWKRVVGRVHEVKVLKRNVFKVVALEGRYGSERVRSIGALPELCSSRLWKAYAVKILFDLCA